MLLNDFHEKVLYKRETLLKEMIASEWGTHAHEMNENHTELKSKIERMKMAFADPEKKGSEVLSYNEPPKGQSRYHEVDGILTRKKEYIDIYDPIKECWRDFRNNFSTKILIMFVRSETIEDIFIEHFFYACMSFEFGLSVIREDEQVAIDAFMHASEYFDKCFGMLWFKSDLEEKNKLSKLRGDAGKKGGTVKSEVYKVIHNELIRLIYAKAPANGWKNKISAVNGVIDSLWEFVEAKKIDSSHVKDKEALHDRVYLQWSKNVEDVKNAFNTKITKSRK